MKKIIFGLVLVVGLVGVALFNQPAVKTVLATTIQCVPGDPQCGTDNGTETTRTDFSGVCPTNYHYQNTGNWNERCHRNDKDTQPNCYTWTPGYWKDWHWHEGKWKASCDEHTFPTGTTCPAGFIKNGSGIDTVCSKTSSCHTGDIRYDSCAPVEQCPTACGQEASRVPDGKGGFNSCDATPSCGTRRWCAPNEDESGFHAIIVPVNQYPPEDGGKPWETGMDKKCELPPPPTCEELQNCPTPPPTPACTENCGNPPTFAGSSTEAPVCSDGNTTQLPANLHVVRAGGDATVNFFVTEGDSANIYWRVVGSSEWQNAVADVKPNADRFVGYTIHGLNPDLGYDFGVQQVRGCSGGQLVVAVVVDGPESQTFRMSYWEWSK